MVQAADTLEWRVCPRFPGHQVSDCGDLRILGGRRLRGYINADGYIAYSIKSGGAKVTVRAHTLVAEAFLGHRPSDRHEIAHRNGSRLLNTPTNLRWALRKENSDDRYRHGTHVKGCRNGRARLTDDDVRFIRSRYREIKDQRGDVSELDRRFGISRSQVCRIAQFKAWAHVA